MVSAKPRPGHLGIPVEELPELPLVILYEKRFLIQVRPLSMRVLTIQKYLNCADYSMIM